MRRMINNLICRTLLLHLTGVENDNVVGDLSDNRQVMGNVKFFITYLGCLSRGFDRIEAMSAVRISTT